MAVKQQPYNAPGSLFFKAPAKPLSPTNPRRIVRSDAPETSHAAAKNVARRTNTDFEMCLNLFQFRPQGYTGHELAEDWPREGVKVKETCSTNSLLTRMEQTKPPLLERRPVLDGEGKPLFNENGKPVWQKRLWEPTGEAGIIRFLIEQ